MEPTWEAGETDEIRLNVAARACEERGLGRELLCGRCTESVITRRRHQLTVTVWCRAMMKPVPADIVECNRFTAQNTMNLWQMRELALPVDGRVAIHDNSYR